MPVSKEEYLRRREARICVRCQEAVKGNSVYCERHLEIKRDVEKRKRVKRLERNLCQSCGIELPDRRWKLCGSCRITHNGIKRDRSKVYRQRLKDAAFEAYGGYVCQCCGEAEPMFLTLDHINGEGARHREEVALHFGIIDSAGGGGRRSWNNSTLMHRWLKEQGYPPIVQVLCYNCNAGKYRNSGVCPHESRKESQESQESQASAV